MDVKKFVDMVSRKECRESTTTSRNSELWECMRYAGLIGPLPEDSAQSEDDHWEYGERGFPKTGEKTDVDEGVEIDT